jgi:hypothetical protein
MIDCSLKKDKEFFKKDVKELEGDPYNGLDSVMFKNDSGQNPSNTIE